MAVTQRVGDLEVAQDLEFQRRQWTVQRVGWVVLLAVLAAALAGLLGRGPLSSRTAATPDGSLRVEYDRFVRRRDPTTLRFQLMPPADRAGDVRLGIDRSYLRGVQVRQITPQPDRVEAGPDRHIFVFRVIDPHEPTGVVFHLEPDEMGSFEGRMGLDGGEAVLVRQFAYP
jgi:hypothetical protein